MNRITVQAVDQHGAKNIVGLLFWACGASAYAGSIEYRLFLMRGKKLLDVKHLRLLFIGEQLLRLVTDELPIKSFPSVEFNINETMLEDYLNDANEVLNDLEKCREKVVTLMPPGRRFGVFIGLAFRDFHLSLAKLCNCKLEEVLLFMCVSFHFDDVHVTKEHTRIGKFSISHGLTDLIAPFNGKSKNCEKMKKIGKK